jgi:hypothetical protein
MLSGRGEGAESFEGKSAPAKAGAAAMKGGGKTESLEDFPEALDGEDDDLPF